MTEADALRSETSVPSSFHVGAGSGAFTFEAALHDSPLTGCGNTVRPMRPSAPCWVRKSPMAAFISETRVGQLTANTTTAQTGTSPKAPFRG